MPTPDYPFVDAGVLERVVKRAARAESTLAFVLLGLVTVAVWYWYTHLYEATAAMSLVIFLVALWLSWPSGDVEDSVHLDDADPAQLGNFTADSLRAAIDEVRQSYNESEMPNIFVVDSKAPLAMTRNASVINFVRPWNAVWISSHLLHVLTEDELKSIFAHEMCHYSHHTTFWSRYFYLHSLANSVLVAVSYAYVLNNFFPDLSWGGLIGWLVAAAFLGLFPIMMSLAHLVVLGVSWLTHRDDSQAIESLCDYEAAKRYGPIPMTNALLKVATRMDIFTQVTLAFSDNPVVPFGEDGLTVETEDPEEATPEDRQKLAAVAAFLHLEENLPLTFISEEEAHPYVEAAVKHAMAEVGGAQPVKHRMRKFVRWLRFDNRVRNQRLDLGEYEDFIDAVRKAPDTPLFAVPEESDAELEAQAEHPSIRNRVLFLSHNLMPKGLGGGHK